MSTFGIRYEVVNTSTNGYSMVVRVTNEKYKAIKKEIMAKCRDSKDAREITKALAFYDECKNAKV